MWPTLVDPFWDILHLHKVHHLVSVSCIVFVHQVERVPLVVFAFAHGDLGSPKGMKLFIKHIVHVNFESVIEALILHILTTISIEVNIAVS